MKTAELDELYHSYLEAIQLGIWGEMNCEKIIYETATYAKLEFIRMNERVKALSGEEWIEGSQHYPFPKTDLLSIE